MTQQIGEPLAIFDVGLMPRNGLHVLGVDQNDLHRAFQDIEDGPPKHSRRFHGHMRDLLSREPIGQRQQPCRGRGEGSHFFANRAAVGTEHHTGHHRLFVDIEPTTARIENLW
jgi:hypothetical protein